jgi:AraC-like DNA-binding protein
LEYEFIDQGSVSILARANIETFLTLHWLFSGDFPTAQFRHRVWQHAGLHDRVNLTATSAEGRAKQKDARIQQMELLSHIRASEHLKAYTPKQIDQLLLKGNWRVGWSWADEAVRAGFHRKYFDNVYGYLCGYSHSSYISAMQIGQAQDLPTQARMAEAGLQISVHIMAHFIHLYASTFSPAADLLNASESKPIVDLWHFNSGDMDPIFADKS